MGWRDHLLRHLAFGIEAPKGKRLDPQLITRAIEQISDGPVLSARLDELDERSLLAEFLELCWRLQDRDQE